MNSILRMCGKRQDVKYASNSNVMLWTMWSICLFVMFMSISYFIVWCSKKTVFTVYLWCLNIRRLYYYINTYISPTMDDGALIDLVRGFTLLYDKRNSDYKNKLKKQNACRMFRQMLLNNCQ
jgi:hypothetical protein